jgi:hypothetical protein
VAYTTRDLQYNSAPIVVMQYYSAFKSKEILCYNMDELEDSKLCKTSRNKGNKCYMIPA